MTPALKLCFGLAVALAPPAMPAAAAIVTVTYTGTIGAGTDVTGVFGVPGDLAGLAYRAVYRFDTAVGNVATSSVTNSVDGGAIGGTASPSLGAKLTIRGIDYAFGGRWFAQSFGYNDGSFSQQHQEVTDFEVVGLLFHNGYLTHDVQNGDASLPARIDIGFSHAVTGADTTGFGFSIADYDFESSSYTANAYGEFLPETVTATVPEPASWTLLIAGFAMIGTALRRQRTIAA